MAPRVCYRRASSSPDITGSCTFDSGTYAFEDLVISKSVTIQGAVHLVANSILVRSGASLSGNGGGYTRNNGPYGAIGGTGSGGSHGGVGGNAGTSGPCVSQAFSSYY